MKVLELTAREVELLKETLESELEAIEDGLQVYKDKVTCLQLKKEYNEFHSLLLRLRTNDIAASGTA